MPEAPCLFPAIRSRDAVGLIAWLGTFGFSVHTRHGDGDRIDHAELALGASILMVGSARDDDTGRLLGDPGAGGGAFYVAVGDVDALFVRAEGAGVDIVEPPSDRDYGSREFTVRDPDGRIWIFGTYWPQVG